MRVSAADHRHSSPLSRLPLASPGGRPVLPVTQQQAAGGGVGGDSGRSDCQMQYQPVHADTRSGNNQRLSSPLSSPVHTTCAAATLSTHLPFTSATRHNGGGHGGSAVTAGTAAAATAAAQYVRVVGAWCRFAARARGAARRGVPTSRPRGAFQTCSWRLWCRAGVPRNSGVQRPQPAQVWHRNGAGAAGEHGYLKRRCVDAGVAGGRRSTGTNFQVARTASRMVT